LRPSTTKNSNRNISFNVGGRKGSNGSKIESDEELDQFPTNADENIQQSAHRSIVKEGYGQNENEKK
jgi:hypothetical protein